MTNEVSKSKIIYSLFWKLTERGGTQGIQFIVQIVLARLLLPEEYGLIALVTIFIALANVFVQNGFSTALIQKQNADEIDFSSVFYLSLLVATLLYTVLFFTAPFIAVFYQEPLLIPILRLLSISLFFGSFNSIQNAYIARNMMFKKLFFSSLGSIIVSGTVGIITAYAGWGVWALVTQQLTNQFMITIILWFTVKWRPKLLFSFVRIKSLFSYGWKLLISALLDILHTNLQALIIGMMYNPATLGFYNRGRQFPELIVGNVNGSIQAVLFPSLSLHQDNREKVKNMVKRSITTSSFIIFPMMVGLAVTAESVVTILLTDIWLPSVPLLQVFCMIFALWPVHTANLQAINALGRSDIFLKLEIIKKVMGIVILLITIPFGIHAMVLGVLFSSIISTIINAYPNIKLINYGYIEQWKDIMPSLLVSMIMGGVIYSLRFLNILVWQLLGLQILVGIMVYVGLAILFRIESFNYLMNITKVMLKNRKGL